MKKSTIRNLAFAGTIAGLMAVPLSGMYLGHQLKNNKPFQIKRLDQIAEELSIMPIKGRSFELEYRVSLSNERQKILSDPNFAEIKADYDSENKNALYMTLYIILGGAITSLSSLGSFMIYRSRNSKNI